MADPVFRALIAGVGRSGTTAVYRSLQELIERRRLSCRYVYEPYLWNPAVFGTVYDDERFTERFNSPSSLHVEGIYAHCKTPLFCSERHSIHDDFLRNIVFRAGQNTLAKAIRVNGRLSAIARLVPDAKIVLLIRNPLDTINSAANLFSFFGDEYHPSDKPRFLAEIQSLFGVSSPPPDDEIAWSRLWWRYMTEAALESAERFPEQIFVVPYEMFVADRTACASEIAGFLGLDRDGLEDLDLESPAATVTNEFHIGKQHVGLLEDCHHYYWNKAIRHADLSLDVDAKAAAATVWARYREADGVPLLNEFAPDRTAIYYRNELRFSGCHRIVAALRRLKRMARPGRSTMAN